MYPSCPAMPPALFPVTAPLFQFSLTMPLVSPYTQPTMPPVGLVPAPLTYAVLQHFVTFPSYSSPIMPPVLLAADVLPATVPAFADSVTEPYWL